MEEKRKFGLTSNLLKMIACATMLIDHIGAVFFSSYAGWMTLGVLSLPAFLGGASFTVSCFRDFWLMRYIGRFAMPIYCYRAAIGGIYTRNRKKYIFRMVLFALIAEIPFDLAFNETWFDLQYNNVMITLTVGVLCVMAAESLRKSAVQDDASSRPAAAYLLPSLLIFAAGAIAAELANADYGWVGVAFIACFYYFRNRPAIMSVVFALLTIAPDLIESLIKYQILVIPVEAAASLALILILLHNGKKGSDSKLLQYGFYAFYPVHLAVIAAINLLILR